VNQLTEKAFEALLGLCNFVTEPRNGARTNSSDGEQLHGQKRYPLVGSATDPFPQEEFIWELLSYEKTAVSLDNGGHGRGEKGFQIGDFGEGRATSDR
jgi:hypothetical protein